MWSLLKELFLVTNSDFLISIYLQSATQCCRSCKPKVFQTLNAVGENNLSFKFR